MFKKLPGLLIAATLLTAPAFAASNDAPLPFRRRVCERALGAKSAFEQKLAAASVATAYAMVGFNFKMIQWQIRALEAMPAPVARAYVAFHEALDKLERHHLEMHISVMSIRPSPFTHAIGGLVDSLVTTFRGAKARADYNSNTILWREFVLSEWGRTEPFAKEINRQGLGRNAFWDQFLHSSETLEIPAFQTKKSMLLFVRGRRLPQLMRAGRIIRLERGLVVPGV
jgi:hypothetical protein